MRPQMRGEGLERTGQTVLLRMGAGRCRVCEHGAAGKRRRGRRFVNSYSAEDGWEVTGLDWETGKTVSRTVFGEDNKGNGAYAILQFLENGDMLFNSVIGPYRISLD